ncbi:MAG TPA: exodeoxyribonuclease VII small subunit [Phycisphaerales bacterium]|nr:exodeoxyribonuclease VII small subunit [Phycisphaerales bacterium]
MTAKRQPEKVNPRDLTFEQAMERVEEIAHRLESGEVGLEQAIDEYEQGMALLRRCNEVLERAEQRVEELTRKRKSEGTESTDDEDDDAED